MRKLKIIKTIVSTNRLLIGFYIKGEGADFGAVTQQEIEKAMSLEQLAQVKFSNNQISVTLDDRGNPRIIEKQNFKLNSLPICIYDGIKCVNIPNSIEIITKFVMHNESIGFRVRYGDGIEDNIRYNNLIAISKWFNPVNFSFRKYSNGKTSICGKNGNSLSLIPEVKIHDNKDKAHINNEEVNREKPVELSSDSLKNEIDILDIYNFIADSHGYVINLASERYKSVTTSVVSSSDLPFSSIGIGEVASPYPAYNASKINVNALFKKVGIVNIEVNGQNVNIVTFVHRYKSIFLNGDNYIKKLAIAVPIEETKKLVDSIGSSLKLNELTDTTIIQPLSQVINVKELKFFTVDTNNIDLISKQKRESSILSAYDIAKLCKRMYELKLISKFLGTKGGLLKQLKQELPSSIVTEKENKKITPYFSIMSQPVLDKLKEIGVDIYTGAYVKADRNKFKNNESSIEIEYSLLSHDASKMTGAAIGELLDYSPLDLPEKVVNICDEVLAVQDKAEQYELANKVYKMVDNMIKDLNKTLWMHNASMYIDGGKSKVHCHDSEKWQLLDNENGKNGSIYKSIEVPGLTVRLIGVSMA